MHQRCWFRLPMITSELDSKPATSTMVCSLLPVIYWYFSVSTFCHLILGLHWYLCAIAMSDGLLYNGWHISLAVKASCVLVLLQFLTPMSEMMRLVSLQKLMNILSFLVCLLSGDAFMSHTHRNFAPEEYFCTNTNTSSSRLE